MLKAEKQGAESKRKLGGEMTLRSTHKVLSLGQGWWRKSLMTAGMVASGDRGHAAQP